jgi:signal transduction histidine kinase
VEVFIRDDGPGIPAESLPRVFERFYRAQARYAEQEGPDSVIVRLRVAHAGTGKVWHRAKPAGNNFLFHFAIAGWRNAAAFVVSDIGDKKRTALQAVPAAARS